MTRFDASHGFSATSTFVSTTKIITVAKEVEGDDQADPIASFLSSDIISLSSSSLPPLDQVTVCSSEHDCDSVSSLSSDECDQSPQCSRRSFFKNYWDKKGGAPVFSRILAPSNDHEDASLSSDRDNESCAANTYERTLKVKEAPTTNRRKVFSLSEPALNQIELRREHIRKTKSTSAQGKPSCLRQSRFSLTSPRPRSESEAQVTFSSQVDVMVYERPKEVFAGDGWSSYFA